MLLKQAWKIEDVELVEVWYILVSEETVDEWWKKIEFQKMRKTIFDKKFCSGKTGAAPG